MEAMIRNMINEGPHDSGLSLLDSVITHLLI